MKELTLNEYQEKAMGTCLSTCENDSYMLLNLVGEVGELASKVAKAIRKGDVGFDYDGLMRFDLGLGDEGDKEFDDELRKEAGDVLWQLAGYCHVMGWTLEDVAKENLEKLASRKKRGVIDGNGDNR